MVCRVMVCQVLVCWVMLCRVLVCHVVDHDRELVHQRFRAQVGHGRGRQPTRGGDLVGKRLNERSDPTGIRKRAVQRELTPPLDHAL
jgi:hypothetical protein